MAIATYFERYKELCVTYRIAHSTYGMVPAELLRSKDKASEALEEAVKQYDVVVECIGYGYAHKKYRVVKNGPCLSNDDLAIICDTGNLCFGYRMEGNIICVHID